MGRFAILLSIRILDGGIPDTYTLVYRLCSACVHVHVVSTHVLTFCPTPSMNVVAEGSHLNACICMFAPPPGILVAVLGEEQRLRGLRTLPWRVLTWRWIPMPRRTSEKATLPRVCVSALASELLTATLLPPSLLLLLSPPLSHPHTHTPLYTYTCATTI